MKRPLTREELGALEAAGYDISTYDGREVNIPEVAASKTSSLAAGTRAAAASAIPTAAGGAGFAGGFQLGLPLAPATYGIAPFVTGLIGAYAGGRLASAGQEAVIPEEWKQQLATDVQEHPVSTTVGSLATMPLAGFNPGTGALRQSVGGVRRLVQGLPASYAEKQALANVAGGTIINAATEAATEAAEGRDISPKDIAIAAGTGALFNKPNRIGKAYGFHPPERAIDNPALLRSTTYKAEMTESSGQVVDKTVPELRKPAASDVLDYIRRNTGLEASNLKEAPAGQYDMEGNPIIPKARLNKAAKTSAGAILEAEKSDLPITSREDPDLLSQLEKWRARKRNQEDIVEVTSPLRTEVQRMMQEQGMDSAESAKWAEIVSNDILKQRNIKVTDAGELVDSKGQPIKGTALLPNDVREVLLNTRGTTTPEGKVAFPTLDTRAHEGLHYMRADIEQMAANGDKKAAELLKLWDNLLAKGLADYNALREQVGKEPVDAHEFAVSEQGLEFVKQQLNLLGETEKQKWARDTEALYKSKYDKNVTLEDLRRAINFRFVNEFNRGVVGKEGPLGKTGKYPSFAVASRNQEAEDRELYDSLVKSLRGKSLDEAQAISKQIEDLKNKYGGMPPASVSKQVSEVKPLKPDLSHGQEAQVDEAIRKQQPKRNQPADEGLKPSIFTTGAEKLLRYPIKNKLPINNAGYSNGTQLLATLKNKLHPTEYQVLVDSGIESVLKDKTVKPEEVIKWIQENGPRVEVRKFGEGEVDERRTKLDSIIHNFYDQLTPNQRESLDNYYNEYSADRESADTISWRNQFSDDLQTSGNDHRWAMNQADDYVKLRFDLFVNPPKSNKGRAHWSMVAPKPESSMPGYVEIAVVKPLKNAGSRTYEDLTGRYATRKDAEEAGVQFPSSHNFPPNTLGFGRGYIESGANLKKFNPGKYEHVPDDAKVAVLIEGQSDWAQQVRDRQSRINDAEVGRAHNSPMLERARKEKQDEQKDPLLPHYERLIIKAWIEHAREQGAEYVAVQDAESAMIMEGHDRQEYFKQYLTTDEWNKLKSENSKIESPNAFDLILKHDSKGYYIDGDIGELSSLQQMLGKKFSLESVADITQEPGMRLHYDTTMPRIMQELTGEKGEKVGLGEHKMAFEPIGASEARNEFGAPDSINLNPSNRPRKDLIFRNPEGTPKTDVSGRLYPINKLSERLDSGDNFTLFNKHQGADEGLTTDNSRKGFLRPLEATFDKVDRVSTTLGEAFRRWEARRARFIGLRNVAINDLQKFTTEEVDRVKDIHREAYRNDKELPALTGKDKEISTILSNYYTRIADIRREAGLRINDRLAGRNPAYVPDMLSDQTLDLLVNKSQTPEAKYAKNEWIKYIVSESKGALKESEVRENISNYIQALGGQHEHYTSVQFGAIRKAAGYGIPTDLREQSALRSLEKYGRRAANDLAMYIELESKPEIAGSLKLKDPNTGVIPTHSKADADLSQATEVRDAMKWVTGGFGGTMSKSAPKVNAFVRLVNNLILGPATGIRNVVQMPVNALPYISKFSDLGAAWEGLLKTRENMRDSLAYAAKQPNIDRLQFDELMDAPDRFTATVQKVATTARKLQGAESIENISRDITFSIGKELARANVLGAKVGDKAGQRFVDRFKLLVDGDVTKMEGVKLEEALNQMAKNFVDVNQGTYGGSGLPVGIVESQFAPFFSLQKWSVEKSNVIYKDVIKPFITGENRLPFITYTLGTVLTGAAIQQLNELLTNRKSQDPTVKEALDKGDFKALASQLATLMQLSGYAGIVGDIMKAGADISKGKLPRNAVSFPTATAALYFEEHTKDMIEAINQGENPVDVFREYTLDLLTHQVQLARMIANRTAREEQVERSDKFRDVRVYNELEGKPAGSFTQSNPYLGLDKKEFKREGDVRKAVAMIPQLVRSEQEKAGGNVEKLRAGLRGLSGNSYQTMPSYKKSQLSFQEFYQFLVRTQGKEEADRRMADYIKQSTVNRVKSALVPKL